MKISHKETCSDSRDNLIFSIASYKKKNTLVKAEANRPRSVRTYDRGNEYVPRSWQRWMKLSLRSPSLCRVNIRCYKYTRLTSENGMLEEGKITVLTRRFQTQPKFIRFLKCYPQWENTAGVSCISRTHVGDDFKILSALRSWSMHEAMKSKKKEWKSNFWLSKVRKLTPFVSEPTASSVSTNIPGSPVSVKQHCVVSQSRYFSSLKKASSQAEGVSDKSDV